MPEVAPRMRIVLMLAVMADAIGDVMSCVCYVWVCAMMISQDADG